MAALLATLLLFGVVRASPHILEELRVGFPHSTVALMSEPQVLNFPSAEAFECSSLDGPSCPVPRAPRSTQEKKEKKTTVTSCPRRCAR